MDTAVSSRQGTDTATRFCFVCNDASHSQQTLTSATFHLCKLYHDFLCWNHTNVTKTSSTQNASTHPPKKVDTIFWAPTENHFQPIEY